MARRYPITLSIPAAALTIVAAGILVACPDDPMAPELGAPGEHWLRIVHISDTQIVDEESPARLVRLDPLVGPAWRPQEAYGIHTLDATLRTINAIHAAGSGNGRPLDFVVMTGDLTDSSQYNELRWFIDTMDGQTVTADSGELDGARRDIAEARNPKLPYAATGLDPAIPWYTVYGNHDGLAVGNFAVDRSSPVRAQWNSPQLWILAEIMGLHRINPLQNTLLPTQSSSPAVLLGSTEPTGPDAFELQAENLRAGPIVPDIDRRFLSRRIFIEEHFNTLSTPPGHGFTAENRRTGLVAYTARPREDVPIRLVVMNTVPSDPPEGLPAFFGVMGREHFESFVQPAVRRAALAGEFVILASHHPASNFDLPFPSDHVGTFEFRLWLSLQPNVIAHIAGHTHRNHVQQIRGRNPYLEIETGAIIDYPQEGRVLDVFYDEPTRTVRFESTLFSHADNPTTFSAESYRRALADRGISPDREEEAQEETESLFSNPAGQPVRQKTYSPAERYGRPEDRTFRISLPRPGLDTLAPSS